MAKPIKNPAYIYTAMLISFIVASALNVYPLVNNLALLRPMWLVMVLIFWLIFQPSRIGVGIAFLVGLSLDLLLDTKMGQQATCAVLIAFLIKFASGYVKQLSAGLVWLLASVCLFTYQTGLIVLHVLSPGGFVPQLYFAVGVSILVWPLLLLALARFTG